MKSLPNGYDENAIQKRLSGELKVEAKPLRKTGAEPPKLLIDIQEKLRNGYGAGFENWARIENIKRSAKTLIFIKESGIDSYAELEQKCAEASAEVAAVQRKIRDISDRQETINELQKHIGTYRKTREIYKQYRAITNPQKQRDFYEEHRAEITLHKAAKRYFDEHLNGGKLPSINDLREQWSQLEKQHRPLCAEYKELNRNFKELCTAKSNASRVLGIEEKRAVSHNKNAEI